MAGNIFLRVTQLCAGVYVLAAVIFTTRVYVFSPFSRLFWHRGHSSSKSQNDEMLSAHSDAQQLLGFPQDPLTVDLNADFAVPLDVNHWANSWPSGFTSSAVVHLSRSNASHPRIPHTAAYDIREETVLSKAFSDAIHPTRIIPFYFKGSKFVDSDDVTITTLVTSNRFRVLKQLVERYRGPISVTIHIPLPLHASFSSLKPDHPSRIALSNLHALYASSPLFAEYVDVHLALSPFTSSLSPDSAASMDGDGGRQFNVWRNAARLFARTNFVMMLDVDFAVCTDWRGFVRDAVRAASSTPIRHAVRTRRASEGTGSSTDIAEVVQRLREGTAALVVPAFEYVKQEEGVDQRTFPADKKVCDPILALSTFAPLNLGLSTAERSWSCLFLGLGEARSG